MPKAWIVVADAARARIFSADSPIAALQPVHDLISPEARLHERDLGSDRPGRVYDIGGEGRHAADAPTSPKQHEAARFAGSVADELERGRLDNAYDRLVLVAEPRFLGLIRKAVKSGVARLVTLEIDKDLSKADPKDIRSSLPDRI